MEHFDIAMEQKRNVKYKISQNRKMMESIC